MKRTKKPAAPKRASRALSAAKKTSASAGQSATARREKLKMIGDLERARAYLHAMEQLGKRLHPLMTETELVDRFERAMQDLFPAAAWVLRVADVRSDDLVLRAACRPARPLSERTASDDTAGGLVSREGRVVELAGHPLSEVAPKGASVVFPIQAALHRLGYLEAALHADSDAVQVVDTLAGQFAVSLRTLRSFDESRNLENYLHSVVDNANSILIIATAQGRIKFFNRLAEQLSGYRREEVLGKNVLRVFRLQHGDRGELRRVFADAIEGRPVVNFEARYRGRGGELRYAVFNSAPISDGAAASPDFIITGLDLTETKRLEHQIIHAEKLASLGEMAAGVAHELNNPLTAIYTNADLHRRILAKEGRSKDHLRRVEAIMEGAERIRGLVRNLMSYVRPAPEDPAAFDLNVLIEQSLTFCKYELTRKGVTLRRELGAELPAIRGYPSQVQQVIINLLTNASQAVPEKGGLVTVRSDIDRNNVVLEVEDNGHGIAEPHLAKIFDPFFTTKAEGRGTGLGLSIVMRIIDKHGARVHVRSKEGAGSVFSIRFPV